MNTKKLLLSLGLGIANLIIISSTLSADERHFAYSYEADSVLPKGKVEIEQWATLRSEKDSGVYSRWDLRHEMEYGFTDTFTGAIYLNTKSIYSDGVTGIEDGNTLKFDGLSLEFKKMIRSPHLNPVGVLLYFEPTYSGKEFELEQKLVLQHIHNEKWNFVTNVISEIEWEKSATETEEESKLQISGGVSYTINPKLSVGLEGKATSYFEGIYSESESTTAFVGPNIHFGTDKIQITAAILKQLTSKYGEAEDLEVRVITGFYF